jgi:hypothetical protein
MTGPQQVEEIQPALRGPRAEPGETVVADLRAEAVLGCSATIRMRIDDRNELMMFGVIVAGKT